MPHRVNDLGQPIGEALPDWVPARFPDDARMDGVHCRVVPIDTAAHAADLFQAFRQETDGRVWTYLSEGPFETVDALAAWLDRMAALDDQVCYALIEKRTGKAAGVASYLRIQPRNGVIEVGSIAYSPRLQKTIAATEAMFLMMKQVFDVWGYRRYEWKCDALNAASRSAAERLGFTYDGLFRQAVVYRCRNRDTAWYSILDKDWPVLEPAYRRWLAADNFDRRGRQQNRLAELIAASCQAAAPD